MTAILTLEELRTPRTAAEMLPWVNASLRRFNTPKLKAEARNGKHYSKKLSEEAYPMALFASRHYRDSHDVVIAHVIGNQSYDATVTDTRPNPEAIQFLEVTSIFSYGDALRRELLTRDGIAPAAGPIRAEGPRHNRESIDAEHIAVSVDCAVTEYLKIVRQAVEKKASHQDYGDAVALIVAVDDQWALQEDEAHSALGGLATSTLVPLLQQRSPFLMVAFEGGRGLHLEYWVR